MLTNKEVIQQVIETGEAQKIPMQPLSLIEDAFKELGFDDFESDGQDTNGWAIDFWYTFNHPQHGKYTVSGSLWDNIPWQIYKESR